MSDRETVDVIKSVFGHRVRITGEQTCWKWLAGKFEQGYGLIRYNGKTSYAHRVSYSVTRGEIPKGLCVLHKCDNRECINPNHLWLGTKAQNNTDRHLKGRDATGLRSGPHTRPESRARGHRNGAHTHPECILRGEDNGCSKLTQANILEIHELRKTGMLQREIASKFGVSQVLISKVLLRKVWKFMDIQKGGAK